MIYQSHALGKFAEDKVCSHLQNQGLRLVTRNYRCYLGEIDLIMWDKQILVFVEVRTRSNRDFATALESITYNKQSKIIKTALFYLQKNHLFNKVPCRFDVVSVEGYDGNIKIRWIKQAFNMG